MPMVQTIPEAQLPATSGRYSIIFSCNLAFQQLPNLVRESLPE
jgi:hypothetical protein